MLRAYVDKLFVVAYTEYILVIGGVLMRHYTPDSMGDLDKQALRMMRGHPTHRAELLRDFVCDVCGLEFQAEQVTNEREDAYQGPLYEPAPIFCPECGSDTVTKL